MPGPSRRHKSSPQTILVQGAREHNLKNLTVAIPRGKFVVLTGVSGSGKSTLAFDILFSEGQRRFLDSLSAYARQFVPQSTRPAVDLISGLPPTVSIEQSTTRGGGKSTVATVTEIYHFIRLLFARLGTQYCPACQLPVRSQQVEQIYKAIETTVAQSGPVTLFAPTVRNRKGHHREILLWAGMKRFPSLRVDGQVLENIVDIANISLGRFQEHDIEVGIARIRKDGIPSTKRPDIPLPPGSIGSNASTSWTLRDAVNMALDLGKGVLLVVDRQGKVSIHSTLRSCPGCQNSFAVLDPKNFSYNSSQGWCPTCRGFGELFHIPDVERGANADSIEESWWGWARERTPCPECRGSRLRPEARAVRLDWATGRKGASEIGPTIDTLASQSVDEASAWFESVRLNGRDAEIARDILPEIRERLRFLKWVGLGYLALGRSIPTLSGGEAQRIRLAAQLGSNLSGVLYVLDEPSIGLHSRDNDRLLQTLRALQSRGNSLIVVEHDEETMRQADHIIDLGPGAGVLGGELVATGSLEDLLRHPTSVTGQCLREKPLYPTRPRRSVNRNKTKDPDPALVLHGANLNNLQGLDVCFPQQRFIAVTGVSGSGKSTLIRHCLLPSLEAHLASHRDAQSQQRKTQQQSKGKKSGKEKSESESESNPDSATAQRPVNRPGKVFPLSGFERFHAVHEVDQSPIGRTPRSTPATYVGFFDEIRQIFASTPAARMRGYAVGRFSYNSPAGRCPECNGTGTIKLEMNFLPTAHVPCETCGGRRFNSETLEVQWSGRSIADVLDLSVAEAIEVFANHPRVLRALLALKATGLDYLRLGQTSPTLSGGEAQRIKLVAHLLGGLGKTFDPRLLLESADSQKPHAKPLAGTAARPCIYLLEEPTIGLHLKDVQRLVDSLQRLVDAGHTVVVIEHNLDLIAEADWVIDLGPEAGDAGGSIVVEGPPEVVANHPESRTGPYLKPMLKPPSS